MSNFEKKVVPYLTYLGLRSGEKLFEEKLMAEEGMKHIYTVDLKTSKVRVYCKH